MLAGRSTSLTAESSESRHASMLTGRLPQGLEWRERMVIPALLPAFREGVELELVLTAATFTASAGATLAGGLVGLVAAVVAGWLLFAGTRRLKARSVFRVTPVLLIVPAGGLAAHGIQKLDEAGWIPQSWRTSGTRIPRRSNPQDTAWPERKPIAHCSDGQRWLLARPYCQPCGGGEQR